MAEIHCYIPIRVRVTGMPNDDQLDQLTAVLERAIAQRIALDDRTVRATTAGGGHPVSGPAELQEPCNAARELQAPDTRFRRTRGRQLPMPAVFYDRGQGPFRPRSKSFFF
jgi:hypothetical protein